jgi:hypothetical protein
MDAAIHYNASSFAAANDTTVKDASGIPNATINQDNALTTAIVIAIANDISINNASGSKGAAASNVPINHAAINDAVRSHAAHNDTAIIDASIIPVNEYTYSMAANNDASSKAIDKMASSMPINTEASSITSAQSSKLTFNRLLTLFQKPLEGVRQKLNAPEEADRLRGRELEACVIRHIKLAEQLSAREPTAHDSNDVTPGQLKWQLQVAIQDVHKNFNAANSKAGNAVMHQVEDSFHNSFFNEKNLDSNAEIKKELKKIKSASTRKHNAEARAAGTLMQMSQSGVVGGITTRHQARRASEEAAALKAAQDCEPVVPKPVVPEPVVAESVVAESVVAEPVAVRPAPSSAVTMRPMGGKPCAVKTRIIPRGPKNPYGGRASRAKYSTPIVSTPNVPSLIVKLMTPTPRPSVSPPLGLISSDSATSGSSLDPISIPISGSSSSPSKRSAEDEVPDATAEGPKRVKVDSIAFPSPDVYKNLTPERIFKMGVSFGIKTFVEESSEFCDFLHARCGLDDE